jgi:hypothetical protein
MSRVQQLAGAVRDTVVARCGLTEVGAPFLPLHLRSTGEPAGQVRVWTGPAVVALIDARLIVPSLGIDSTMLHAFTPAGSPTPHLASDLVGLGDRVTFNVDLTPCVDLATEPLHVEATYAPLSSPRAAVHAIPDIESVDLPAPIAAFASPWIVGVNADIRQLDELAGTYRAYVECFCDVALAGADPVALGPVELARRDEVVRRAQFDPSSDEVWDVLADLVGVEARDVILTLLQDQDPPREVA